MNLTSFLEFSTNAKSSIAGRSQRPGQAGLITAFPTKSTKKWQTVKATWQLLHKDRIDKVWSAGICGSVIPVQCHPLNNTHVLYTTHVAVALTFLYV